MRKFLFLFSIIYSSISFSQKDTSILNQLYQPIPIHFIKIDIFKTVTNQVHLDYERYNGKNGAIEIGFGFYYPNPILKGAAEGWSKHPTNPYAFHYIGYGIELKRKFYLNKKRFRPYVAPELFFKSKSLDHIDVLVEGESGSSYSIFNTVTRTMNAGGGNLLIGVMFDCDKLCRLDLNFGFGAADVDVNTIVNYYGSSNYRAQIEGYNNYIALSAQCSIKLCFGIKGKER